MTRRGWDASSRTRRAPGAAAVGSGLRPAPTHALSSARHAAGGRGGLAGEDRRQRLNVLLELTGVDAHAVPVVLDEQHHACAARCEQGRAPTRLAGRGPWVGVDVDVGLGRGRPHTSPGLALLELQVGLRGRGGACGAHPWRGRSLPPPRLAPTPHPSPAPVMRSCPGSPMAHLT